MGIYCADMFSVRKIGAWVFSRIFECRFVYCATVTLYAFCLFDMSQHRSNSGQKAENKWKAVAGPSNCVCRSHWATRSRGAKLHKATMRRSCCMSSMSKRKIGAKATTTKVSIATDMRSRRRVDLRRTCLKTEPEAEMAANCDGGKNGSSFDGRWGEK